jgi:hypothetical protein
MPTNISSYIIKQAFARRLTKILGFSLQYAQSVEEKGRGGKFLQVAFKIPSEEKPISFDLRIWVKNRTLWLGRLCAYALAHGSNVCARAHRQICVSTKCYGTQEGDYLTVTDLAKFLGMSGSHFLSIAM